MSNYIISFVLQEIGRDIFTSASKLFKTGTQVDYEDIRVHAENQALNFVKLISTATKASKIRLIDDKQRCHLEALEVK